MEAVEENEDEWKIGKWGAYGRLLGSISIMSIDNCGFNEAGCFVHCR